MQATVSHERISESATLVEIRTLVTLSTGEVVFSESGKMKRKGAFGWDRGGLRKVRKALEKFIVSHPEIELTDASCED